MARNKYPEETRKLILDTAQRLFLEKGYENTSIQDIINGLGGLSKGAVYHHFKSKEEIFDAVGEQFNAPVVEELKAVRDDRTLSGYGKLKKMFSISLANSDGDIVYTVAPDMLDNPKLLALEMRQIITDTSPNYVQPVVEQGIADGSVKTDYPQELAEVLLLLSNIWLNPLVLGADADAMERRVRFFNELLKPMGMDVLDADMLEAYLRYCRLANNGRETQ
jgi:AcrR family transcriptional regulator